MKDNSIGHGLTSHDDSVGKRRIITKSGEVNIFVMNLPRADAEASVKDMNDDIGTSAYILADPCQTLTDSVRELKDKGLAGIYRTEGAWGKLC